MVEFIDLPFPFPSKLKIWSFHAVVVQWRQRMYKKACCTCRVVVLLIKPIVFWLSRCHRRRGFLRSLMTRKRLRWVKFNQLWRKPGRATDGWLKIKCNCKLNWANKKKNWLIHTEKETRPSWRSQRLLDCYREQKKKKLANSWRACPQ